MKAITDISLYSILFVVGAIGPRLGLDFKFFIFFYFLLFIFAIIREGKVGSVSFLLPSFLVMAFILLYRMVVENENEGIFFTLKSVIIPLFILGIIVMDLASVRSHSMPAYLSKRKKFVITFFCLECLVAFVEKILSSYLFAEGVWGVDEGVSIGFRSAAFLGHPLQNALCVSIMMSFILTSSSIKPMHKYSLTFLGWLSLLCFNTRSSILLWFFLIIMSLLGDIFKKGSFKKKVLSVLLIVIGIGVVLYFLFHLHWGDRLLYGDLMDGSAMTRINVYDVFDYISDANLWWGTPSDVLWQAQLRANCLVIENSFVMFVLNFGIVFTAVLILLVANIIRKLLKNYSFKSKAFIIVAFLLISNANNALAVSAIPLSVFFLCSVYFTPMTFNLSKS